MMQLRKIKVLTFFFLSFVCSQTTVYGQMISGKIIDAEQLPIDGATIILQAMDSTYIAASISNTDGIFVFNSQQEEYRLIIQHILYETKQMAGDAFPRAELSPDEALAYLRREVLTLPPDVARGYVVATFEDRPLGFLNNLGSRANNLYHSEWRIRKL